MKPVFKSAAVTTSQNQQRWHEAILDTNLLCNGDNDAEFRMDFYLSRSDGNHKLLGSHSTSLNRLQ